ncbi:MAG: hypothetical protein R3C44_22445 [Chloroflexota bacterium]
MPKTAALALMALLAAVTLTTAAFGSPNDGSGSYIEPTFNPVTAVPNPAGAGLKANHIIYDEAHDRLIASVPSSHATLGNSIVPMFRDGRLGDPVPVGSEPNVLAISGDGLYLYVGLDGVGAVRRVNLETMTPDIQWSLGNDLTCGRFVAGDMVVLDHMPASVAVARHNPCRSTHEGVVVYDNGVMRPSTTPTANPNDVIEPSADPAVLLGLDRDSTGRDFHQLAVDSTGVNEVSSVADLLTSYASDIRYIDGRLYAPNGDVINTADFTYAGQFDAYSNALPIVRNGRAFFLVYVPSIGGYELQVFDAGSFTLLAATVIGGLSDSQPGNLVDFIDTGLNSMGIRLGDGDVFWLSIRLVQHTSYFPLIGKGANEDAR